jgi:uncharacterized phage protein (TIGR01671 family)
MNRLKFRVWNAIDKSFHKNLRNYFILNLEGDVGIVKEDDVIIFKPDCFIVQQFTGLLDSLDREIYEGDIVENFTSDEEYCSPAVIVPTKYEYTGWSLAFKNKHLKDFQKEQLGHLINNIEVFEEFQLMQKNFGYYKIIGNIFENPELLKS